MNLNLNLNFHLLKKSSKQQQKKETPREHRIKKQSYKNKE